MNFLNSAILAGLAAALGPLLIHLLNRRRVRTLEFSSVMFLRDLRRTRMRRLQLRRWLLLIIRTLIVAFAVLAFARPALKGGVFAALGSRARTTAVVALDRSASMAQESVNGSAYERAQKRVNEIAALTGEGDQVVALPFAGPEAPVADAPTADVARLVKRLSDLPVSYAGTDAGAALNEALKSAGSGGNLNREIYLLSDMRREGFTKTVVLPATSDMSGVTIYLVDVSGDGGYDLGVSDVKVGDQLISVGLPFDLTATIANNTDQTVDKLLVSLFIDGRRVAQREITVDARGTAVVPFLATVENGGMHSGFVEISA
ncbi:MAG: BatA domain-containing protein, partial [candidate division Zixibacteria bacterium]|nr:BatA domain-containing protein [candidate division Zixibacteria bacterium]